MPLIPTNGFAVSEKFQYKVNVFTFQISCFQFHEIIMLDLSAVQVLLWLILVTRQPNTFTTK